MTTRTRRRLTAAALCTAGLVVAGAPLAAVATHGRDHHPSRHHKPSYGQPGFTPGKAGSAALAAVLLGRNEIGPTGRRRAGDPDGLGSATVGITKTNQVCYGIVVQGLQNPTAAAIYQGKHRHQTGTIVLALTPPATGDPGASSGCVAVDPGLAFDLRKHADRYYVDVKTPDFPAGALRGQLHRI